jgi:aspartate aminotransferase
MQIAAGWLLPNAVLQYAVPTLENLAFDVPALEAKRDRLVTALRGMGYEVASPEGTFYLRPRSPVPDEEAFVASLERRGVLVLPGTLFETPGWFRVCPRRPPSPSRLRCPTSAPPSRRRGTRPRPESVGQRR